MVSTFDRKMVVLYCHNIFKLKRQKFVQAQANQRKEVHKFINSLACD